MPGWLPRHGRQSANTEPTAKSVALKALNEGVWISQGAAHKKARYCVTFEDTSSERGLNQVAKIVDAIRKDTAKRFKDAARY